MEFKLKIEDVKTYAVGDFVLCNNVVYMIVLNSNDDYILINLNDKCVEGEEYLSISELLKEEFGSIPYRIIKNNNVSFIEN